MTATACPPAALGVTDPVAKLVTPVAEEELEASMNPEAACPDFSQMTPLSRTAEVQVNV
jgi:hypothetical protein